MRIWFYFRNIYKIITYIVVFLIVLHVIDWIFNEYQYENNFQTLSFQSNSKCSNKLKNRHIRRDNINYFRKPKILWWTTQADISVREVRKCSGGIECEVIHGLNSTKDENIEAYQFYGSEISFTNLPLPRRPREIIWGLYHEESPRNVPELSHEPILKLFNFSATFSICSDVPLTLQYLTSIEDITSVANYVPTLIKNELLKDNAPILYLQSDCSTTTERDEYVKELMKYIKVDSYGNCLNNKQLPQELKGDYLNNLYDNAFLNFVAKYKFVIAIENGICKDYVTEKLWRPIIAGSVPIYFGSPNIEDWLPNNKSAILIQDYASPKVLSDYIDKLLHYDKLYDEYLDHKIKRIITNQRLISESNRIGNMISNMEKLDCIVCEALHEKHEGYISENIVDTSHYECPIPISALTFNVNYENPWVYIWEDGRKEAHRIYKEIMRHK